MLKQFAVSIKNKKQSEQRVNSHRLLASGLVGCSIFNPIYCVSAADSLSSTKPDKNCHNQHTCIPRNNTDKNAVSTIEIKNDILPLHGGFWKGGHISPPEIHSSFANAEFSPRGELNSSPLPLIGGKGESLKGKGLTNNEIVQFEPVTPEPTVSQLTDVKPTDWAYQALKALVEKYGAISGYADNTFRGDRSLSRDEFAAALLATLDNLDRLAVSISDEYIKSDAVIIRRLQTEFADNLKDLRLRTRLMEERVNRLETQQISPTTKLQGQAIFAFTDGHQASSTIINRTRLNLNTSFRGGDLLVTQLEFGNNGTDAITKSQSQDGNLLGTNGLIVNGGGLDIVGVDKGLKLRRLYYSFRPFRDVEMVVGAKMSPRDFIDRNPYANNEAVDFSSSFFLNNPLIVQNQIDRVGGAGLAITWHPQDSKLFWRSLYIGGDDNDGLFGDNYQASVEVEYAPSDCTSCSARGNRLSLKLQYTNALVNNTDINALGLNAAYAFNQNTGIFARLGFGSYQGFNTAINEDLDLNPFTWTVGLGWRNLFIPSSVAGIAVGQPFVTSKLGNGTQTNFEIFYNLSLKENFSITPVFSLVVNPDSDRNQDTIWQTTLRTVISF